MKRWFPSVCGVAILCLIGPRVWADIRQWFGLSPGNRHVVYLFDVSESFRDTVIYWSDLTPAELARVLHQSRDGSKPPNDQFLAYKTYAALYDTRVRDCLKRGQGHCRVDPGFYNDIWTLAGLMRHCGLQLRPQADGALCIPFRSGLDAQSAAKSIVPATVFGALEDTGILVAIPGSRGRRAEYPYDTFRGDAKTFDAAYQAMQPVVLSQRQYKTRLPGMLEDVLIRLQGYVRSGKIQLDPGQCDRVHVVLVSDFNLTRDDFDRLQRVMARFRQAFGEQVALHHVFLETRKSNEKAHVILERAGSRVLDWIDLFRSPWGALIASEPVFPYGCSFMRQTPALVQIGPVPRPAKLVAYTLPNAWLGQIFLYDGRDLNVRASIFSPACRDNKPETPCGTELFPRVTPRLQSQSGNLRDPKRRRLYIAWRKPKSRSVKVARVELNQKLAPGAANELASMWAVEPEVVQRTLRYYLGDASVEISRPDGLFRERCMTKDGRPGMGCKAVASFFEGSIVDYRNVVMQYAAWSRLDDFRLLSMSDNFWNDDGSRFYLYISGSQCQIRALEIRANASGNFWAQELWSFVPPQFVEKGQLFAYALPRPDAPDCFVFLKGFLMGGKRPRRYLVGAHPTTPHEGLFVLDTTDPRRPPDRSLRAVIDERTVGEPVGQIRAFEAVDRDGVPLLVFGRGAGVTGPFCVYAVHMESGQVLHRRCFGVRDAAITSLMGRDGAIYFGLRSGRLVRVELGAGGQFDARMTAVQLVTRGRLRVVVPVALVQAQGPRPVSIGILGRLYEIKDRGRRVPTPDSALVVVNLDRLWRRPVYVLDAGGGNRQVAWARLQGDFWRVYRLNRPWPSCKRCEAWALILERGLMYRVEKRIGAFPAAYLPVLVRSADCARPVYSVVLFREAWLLGPAPKNYRSTRHPYAYNNRIPVAIHGFGFRVPGPVFGLMGPHGSSFSEVIVSFADPERNYRTVLARVPMLLPRGRYRPPPVPPKTLGGGR